MKLKNGIIYCSLLLLAACNNNTTEVKKVDEPATASADSSLLPSPSAFHATINGKETNLYVLKNNNGMQAAITNYGGRLVSLIVPDKNGKPVDVVIGFDSVSGYQRSTEPYFGATIGRYGNRIAKGKF